MGEELKTKVYKIQLTPLEPYTFGTDQGLSFAGIENSRGKESYYVLSKMVPEQTTIWGMLRYVMLQKANLVESDFGYSDDNKRKKMETLIGKNSFSFASKTEQDFGRLIGISPIFLKDQAEKMYMKNPQNNKSTMEYCPIEMEDAARKSSRGKIHFPKKGEYDAKMGTAQGWIRIEPLMKQEKQERVISMPVEEKLYTAIRKTGTDDAFFKRKAFAMKEGYAFVVYAEVKEEQESVFPEKTVCYMGLKKSAFKFEASLTDKKTIQDVVDDVSNVFKNAGSQWTIAMSDIVLLAEGDQKYGDDFYIISGRKIQNLETQYQSTERGYAKRLKRSKVQYNLLDSGSAFYGTCMLNLDNKNHKKLGYNYLISTKQ